MEPFDDLMKITSEYLIPLPVLGILHLEQGKGVSHSDNSWYSYSHLRRKTSKGGGASPDQAPPDRLTSLPLPANGDPGNKGRNIYQNENDVEYRKLKTTNNNFNKKVWSIPVAREFMLACGWLNIHDVLVYNKDDEYLLPILSIIVDHRHVRPKEKEWVHETKVENLDCEKHKEEALRQKAAVEREKELDEFKKDKAYRDALAADVKAKIKADQERRKQQPFYSHAVKGNKLRKDARVKTLHSLDKKPQ